MIAINQWATKIATFTYYFRLLLSLITSAYYFRLISLLVMSFVPISSGLGLFEAAYGQSRSQPDRSR